MSSAYFVTGTDTNVGKTVLSAALCVALGAHYWKPVQTGNLDGTDSDFLRSWIGSERVHPEAYSFPEPLSPHLAAEISGREISLAACAAALPRVSRPLIVEGAGGLLVPLSPSSLMADLILHLKMPVIVAANTKLGTINHTLLTLEALRSRRIPLAGVVTIGQECARTRKSISRHGQAPLLGHLAFLPSFSSSALREAGEKLKLPYKIEAPCTTLSAR